MMNKSYKQAINVRQSRGRLKIYLGYAAGVGKTFAMLHAARRRQVEEIDVVVGYLDINGRFQIDDLLAGLEIIPPRSITYRGTTSFEMDTDAILKRHPQLALVDDLAHTNSPGARHVHRYQDVLELLNSGIDVHTTMNIQSLESLNDVVLRVTGVIVQGTVPDHILDEAYEIELIDLPVAELLQRLEAGLVKGIERKQQAADKFFRPGNLTALREMALRRAAERVDEQMRDYMQKHAISGPWPAGERVLVCVSPSPLSERLVRTARRLARRLDAEWIAVFVEVSGYLPLSEADEARVAQTLQLAEELGAKTVRLNGHSIAESILNYALERNVTKIVVGKSLRSQWKEWLHGSIIDQILRHSHGLDVYVISGKVDMVPPSPVLRRVGGQPFVWRSFWLSAGLVLLATWVGLPLRPFVNPTNLVMLYLVMVMLAAVWLGLWPALTASLLSVLAFDIIFVPPYYTFAVNDAEYLLTFAGLLAVGLVISSLAARSRLQALDTRRREAETATLYELSQGLAAAPYPTDLAQTIVTHVKNAFDSPVAIFLPDKTSQMLTLHSSTPDFYQEADEHVVVDWVFRHGQPAGRFTGTLTDRSGHYFPLQTSEQVMGVLAIEFSQDYKSILTSKQRRFLTSLSTQVASALEKANLTEQARHAQLLEETEKLQTTLLNSISHDLRTPLASITGVLSSLRDDAELLTEPAKDELLFTAWEEALRLNRLVGNLLDMTRLQSGAMKVVSQPYEVQELVGATLAQMTNRLQGRTVKRSISDALPPVMIDLTLMVQALMNLLDNAVKYAPQNEPIEIEAYEDEQMVLLMVKDRGPGVPEAELEHIFRKFFRLDTGSIGGTGLGLSIAKGIVDAHNGRIWAENRPGGGMLFGMTLPPVTLEELPQV
jgi:two-component system, OmpR family, sensor histidine kinase KdpD